MTGASEGAVDDDLRGGLHVSIRHDHDVVLSASLTLHTLAMTRAFGIDVPGNRGRAYKADAAHLRVREQGIHCLFAAVKQIQNAGW